MSAGAMAVSAWIATAAGSPDADGASSAFPRQVSALPVAAIRKAEVASNARPVTSYAYHYSFEKNGKQVYFGSEKPLTTAQLNSVASRLGASGGPKGSGAPAARH